MLTAAHGKQDELLCLLRDPFGSGEGSFSSLREAGWSSAVSRNMRRSPSPRASVRAHGCDEVRWWVTLPDVHRIPLDQYGAMSLGLFNQEPQVERVASAAFGQPEHVGVAHAGTEPGVKQLVDLQGAQPASIPQPDGAKLVLSMKNLLGEGGVWELEFSTPTMSDAQKYVDVLAAAGWGFNGPSEGLTDGKETDWSMHRKGALATISTTANDASPVPFNMTVMGKPD